MPTPPNFKPQPLTPEYLWNESAAQYTNKRTGRFVSRRVIRDQLDKVVDASAENMVNLAKQLQAGEVSLAEWQVAMMQEIKTTHLASAAMQKGGWQQMTQADFGRVGRIVRREYRFLTGPQSTSFVNQIVSGKQKLDGTLIRRAMQYGQSGRGTYYRFWDTEADKRGFDEERSILNPADHCTQCVDEAAKGFQKRGDMVPLGQRICRANDQCDKEYRNSQTGETIRV
jgi:hypothetical protein